jgi:hypothetical protein
MNRKVFGRGKHTFLQKKIHGDHGVVACPLWHFMILTKTCIIGVWGYDISRPKILASLFHAIALCPHGTFHCWKCLQMCLGTRMRREQR